MGRHYFNHRRGKLTADASAGATTLTDTNAAPLGFASLPVVEFPDIVPITLDPNGATGEPERCWIVGHTASATSVTVIREPHGENATARSHASGTAWEHAPGVMDVDPTPPDLAEVLPADSTEFTGVGVPAGFTFVDAAAGAGAFDSALLNERSAVSFEVGRTAANDFAFYHRALASLSAAPATIETAVRIGSALGVEAAVGIWLADGAVTASEVVASVLRMDGLGVVTVESRAGAAFSSLTVDASATLTRVGAERIYLRLNLLTTTTYRLEWSLDGFRWHRLPIQTHATMTAPTHVGWCFSDQGDGGEALATLDYLRTYDIVLTPEGS